MENNEEIDLKRILRIIYSKKIFIILILLLSLTLGYVYSYYYKKPEYKTSVTVLLVADENKTDKELTQTDLNINTGLISTYSSIAKSTNVLQKTIDNLELNMNCDKLKKNIEATQVEKTQFIEITVKNDNPETARNIANELAKVFTEQIKEIYNLKNISIVDEAEKPNIPFNINHFKDILIFSCLGLFISAIFIMSIFLLDDTIKDEKDIEKNIKIQTIGRLPIDKEKNELIIENNPKSNIVESIKTIRTNILYANNKKTILITSCRPKEGKSWIIDNLAVAYAQTGKRVILVDTDLRKENNKNEIFNVEKGEGLSDFIKEISDDKLENLAKAKKYIKETKISNLHMLQNGTIPPNPAELISSENMKRLLDLLKSMYDVVLLDGTPCMMMSDSIALSSMVDTAILVAESKKTKINDLKKIKKLIEDVNGKILGVIINKAEIQSGKYYGKKYGYYYGSESKEVGKIEEKQKPISLEEIVKIAEENIREELLNKEEVIEENNDIPEENQDVNYEIKNIKNEILNEIKKLKNIFTQLKNDNTKNQINAINSEISNLKEIQADNNKELLNKIGIIKETQNSNNKELTERIDSINYEEKFKQINNELKNNKEEYTKIVKEINDKLIGSKEEYSKVIENIKAKDDENLKTVIHQFISEINNLKSEIKELRDTQNNNNSEILGKIEENNFEEKLAKINERIENINYDEQLAKINERIENINYDEQLAKINERIENINYDEKLTEIHNKIQENEKVNVNNVISFETLKEKRKANKKVFKTSESINFEDLERLSACIIDLNGELNDEAMSN